MALSSKINKAVAIALGAFVLNTASITTIRSARGATPPVDESRPLGILLSPKMMDAKPSLQVPREAPELAPPPLGTLWNPGTYKTPPTPHTPIQQPASIQRETSNGISSFPGKSQRIETPETSEIRPLGILINTPPPDTATPVSVTRTHTQRHPGKPVSVHEVPKWNASGQSQARPLGTLFAPDTPPEYSDKITTPVLPNQFPSEEGMANSDEPAANFSADEMSFNRETSLVSATGNVVVHHQNRSLSADTITYNRETGAIKAKGNVVLTETTGEVVYGDLVEISGDLKNGIIKNIGVILSDRSRIAGAGGQRSNGLITEMHKAVYSPCQLCKEDPNRPPVWQIKAVKVVHNKTEHIVEYRDAWIEFFGYPVIYTPYFRHPDPTVKRKSGFLFPTLTSSSDLGTIIQTPYFWNISPHEDATITPMLMTNAAPLLNVEYRKKMLTGELDITSSLTANSNDANAFSTEKGKFGLRGHIRSEGRFDLNNTWRWGFDANGTTDDTYLRRYGFSSPASLNSRLFAESFRKQSYFSANTYAFQGLQTDDNQDEIPIVLPLIDFNHVGKRDRFGGTTSFDFNFLALTRNQGVDTRRLSLHSIWQRPIVGRFGDFYNFTIGLNADLYHTNNLNIADQDTKFSGFSHRVIPEMSLDWRLPLAKSEGAISQILEPVAAVVWSPYGGNPNDIPNEDSVELEFDDTNLFSRNRFSGVDRVEGGPRIAYGLKWGAFGKSGGSTRIFVGQSWRPKTDDTFASGSGLENNFSDIVARIDVTPGEYLDMSYRTRFSTDQFSPNRNEIKLSAGVPAFRVNANYVFLDQQTDSEFSGREELNFTTNTKINRFWRTGFSGVRDMAANEFRTAGIHLIYEDECVTLTTNATRTFFEDRDIEPTDSITFRLLLKTLGEVHSGFSQSQ